MEKIVAILKGVGGEVFFRGMFQVKTYIASVNLFN